MNPIHFIQLLNEEIHEDIYEKDDLCENYEPKPIWLPFERRKSIDGKVWVKNNANEANYEPHRCPEFIPQRI